MSDVSIYTQAVHQSLKQKKTSRAKHHRSIKRPRFRSKT